MTEDSTGLEESRRINEDHRAKTSNQPAAWRTVSSTWRCNIGELLHDVLHGRCEHLCGRPAKHLRHLKLDESGELNKFCPAN
jgi:hypothetical protein